MKREETVYICERCGGDIRVPAKKLFIFHISGKLPKEWDNLTTPEHTSFMVCKSCLRDYNNHWDQFIHETPSSKQK